MKLNPLGSGPLWELHDHAESESKPLSFRRGFLIRFVPVSVAIITVLGLIATNEWRTQEAVYHQAVDNSFEIARAVIDSALREVETDLLAVVGSEDLKEMFGDERGVAQAAYAKELVVFSNAKRRYDQIRYIGERGAELVRVDIGPEGPAAVPDAKLRDESQRSYVRDGNTLAPNEVLVSPLSLDVEHREVDTPAKPTIRFVGAVFDGAGARRGIVVLNYLAAQLIADLREAMRHTTTPMLLNGDGYWLAGPNPDDEFGFIWPERRDRSFAASHPEAWARISASNRGHVDTSEGDYGFDTLTYLRRRPYRYGVSFLEPQAAPADVDTETWKIVVFRPKSLGTTAADLLWFVLTGAAMLLLSAVLCARLSREQAQRAAATAASAASEGRLREQLAFTQALLESLPVPVFVKDAQGRYLGCNHAFEALMGRARADILGRTIGDLLPGEEAALHADKDEQVLKLREKQTYEAQRTDPDGARRHCLLFKSPTPDESNGGSNLVGVVLDISERKTAERSLRNSHEFLIRILNTIPQPIFVKNRNHRFVFLNDAACAYVGFAREQMLGKSDHDFFPKEQADVFVAKDEQVFTQRGTNFNEETITDASGAERVILTKKAVFENEFGEDVLVGVFTDITERKRTEEILRLGAEVFEHSAEGIMVTGHEGTIVAVNRAFVEITGYTVEEAIGRNPRMLGSGKHDQQFFDEIFAAADRDGWWKGEIVNRRKSGEIYVVEQTICAVRDDVGHVRRYIGMMGDITERKSREERMRYLAQHDFLTGLANRAVLGDRIERAILRVHRNRRKVAVLLLDLDCFKEINDTHGHAVGDCLLKQVAGRLLRAIRQTDTVSRLGGDEFVIVLPDLRARVDAERIAQKVIEELSPPFELESVRVKVGVSLGIALYPDDAADGDALCRAADAAMYRGKQARKQASNAQFESQ